jgi:endonuclease/exonuclease/phosphatase family metal-dependent hydrolase
MAATDSAARRGDGPSNPSAVLFGTYNAQELFKERNLQAQDHYRKVVELIRGLNPHVLAIQEIRGKPQRAKHYLRILAYDSGMKCEIPSGGRGGPVTALAMGSHGYHSGLLWRPATEVVPGSFGESGPERLWHSAGWATFRFGGRPVRHATFHATPFDRKVRTRDNAELLSLLRQGSDSDLPLLIGGDWNAESADLVTDPVSGDRVLYEPGDPFADVPWREDMVHHCLFANEPDGTRRHWVDRSAGEVLLQGGLHDAAAVLGAPWQATTAYLAGEGDAAVEVGRRIDAIRVTADVIPALRGHRVIENEHAKQVSDHLPVIVSYVPADIAA